MMNTNWYEIILTTLRNRMWYYQDHKIGITHNNIESVARELTFRVLKALDDIQFLEPEFRRLNFYERVKKWIGYEIEYEEVRNRWEVKQIEVIEKQIKKIEKEYEQDNTPKAKTTT